MANEEARQEQSRLDEAPRLRLVNPDTGEITETCPGCAELDRQLDGAEKEIRAWRTRYAKLKADKDAEARDHKLWGLAVALFQEWKIACNHPLSGWTADRFFLVKPFLEAEGFNECCRAVWGIGFDPNTRVAKNGHLERYDSWELLWRNRATFERYRNRCPRGWPDPVPQEDVT